MSTVTITVDPAGHLVVPESLRQEAGIIPGVSFELTLTDGRIELKPVEMPTVSSAEAEPRSASQIEAEIDQIYYELRDLVALLPDAPEVKTEIERKREQLRGLKAEEAHRRRVTPSLTGIGVFQGRPTRH